MSSLLAALRPYYLGAAMGAGPARRLAAWDRYVRLAAAVSALGDDLLVLDVGCGPGDVGRMLAATQRLVGVDLDPRAAEGYSHHGLGIAGDALALPFDDATFDVVMSGQTLYVLPLDEALSELARVLRPGGTIVLEQGMASDVSLWPTLAYWALRRRLPGRLRLREPATRWTWRRLARGLRRHGLVEPTRTALEIASGPLYSRKLASRLTTVGAAFPGVASHFLVVATRR